MIGTDITGLDGSTAAAPTATGSSGAAIVFGASFNVISGTPTAPEVISANAGDGVLTGEQGRLQSRLGRLYRHRSDGEHTPSPTPAMAWPSIPQRPELHRLRGEPSQRHLGQRGQRRPAAPASTPMRRSSENSYIGIDAAGTTAPATVRMACWSTAQATENFIGYALPAPGT